MQSHSTGIEQKCPRCSGDLHHDGDFPTCLFCGYEAYDARPVRADKGLPKPLAGRNYLVQYGGKTKKLQGEYLHMESAVYDEGYTVAQNKFDVYCPFCLGKMDESTGGNNRTREERRYICNQRHSIHIKFPDKGEGDWSWR